MGAPPMFFHGRGARATEEMRAIMLEVESGNSIVIEAACSASLEAARNWKRNLSALGRSLTQIKPEVEFVFARDGTLTALEDGKWWGGCSVPQKAAEELLQMLNITSPVACFLCPTHPAQIAFSLARLKRQQAVIVLLPRFDDLLLTLHCHDFSADVAAHRLWFVAGEDWPRQMVQLFEQNAGLPLPQQFIRTVLLNDDASAPLIAAAQKIFSDELIRRGALLSDLRQSRASLKKNRFTLAANLCFRLWDDAGGVLQEILSENDIACTLINFDDPAQASPLALAHAAAESEAIVTANLTRADCGQFLHPQIPLISWLTTRPIPAFDPSCERDALLLTNDASLQLAKKYGWPSDRLFLLPWPAIASSTSAAAIAIIADTRPIDPTPAFDLSSHQLLWDLIRAELQTPQKINDIQAYLHSRMKRLNISDHGLDQRRFIEELIVPAYQQSLVAELLKAKIAIRIFGQGWRDIPAFAAHAAGPITSREQLKDAISTSAALIHLWPSDNSHPIDTAGPPIIRLNSRGLPGVIADARLALQGKLIKPPAPAADAFDIAGLARILRTALGD